MKALVKTGADTWHTPKGGNAHYCAAEVATAKRLLEALDGPISLGIYLRLKYVRDDPNLWGDIANAEVCAGDYVTLLLGDRVATSRFADDYAAVSLLRKSPNIPSNVDGHVVAVTKSLEAEARCAETNGRLHLDAIWDRRPEFYSRFKRLLRRMMGDLTESVLTEITGSLRLTGGSTVGMDKAYGITQSGKFRSSLTSTRELFPLVKSLFADLRNPQDLEHDATAVPYKIGIVEGEIFGSVPKTAKTRRGIAPQPSVNLMLQAAIGDYLQKRLAKFGFDISDQGLNQILAKQAYALGLSTIDLSMASDLISRELVRDCVSPRWYSLLSLARCGRLTVTIDDKTPELTINLERFSSMGNGFTFALETLIFGALIRAVVPSEEWLLTSAYGDDLIVPKAYFAAVVEGLEYLGFKTNDTKSYRDGDFFESCGTDWFRGQNVRPIFFSRSNEDDEGIPIYVSLANAIRVYAKRRGIFGTCDARFQGAWQFAYDRVPKRWKIAVPASLGDVGIITERPSLVQRGHFGILVRHYNVESKTVDMVDDATVKALLAAASGRLSSVYIDGLTDQIFQSLEDMTDVPWDSLYPEGPYRPVSSLEIPRCNLSPQHGFKDTIRNQYGWPMSKTTQVSTWDMGWEWL
jgi:hypothetical protein